MGFLVRLYVKKLLDGNPFVVGITVLVAVALAAEPFYKALQSGDPAAIALVAGVVLGAVILLVLAIVDRRLNAPKRKKPMAKSGRR